MGLASEEEIKHGEGRAQQESSNSQRSWAKDKVETRADVHLLVREKGLCLQCLQGYNYLSDLIAALLMSVLRSPLGSV